MDADKDLKQTFSGLLCKALRLEPLKNSCLTFPSKFYSKAPTNFEGGYSLSTPFQGLLCRAQVCEPPAATATTGRRSAGTSHWPNSLFPKPFYEGGGGGSVKRRPSKQAFSVFFVFWWVGGGGGGRLAEGLCVCVCVHKYMCIHTHTYMHSSTGHMKMSES